LLKLLEALDTSPTEFFAAPGAAEADVIFHRQADMQVLDDGDRRWRYLFPNRRVVKAVMTYEEYRPKTRQVVTEKHPADVCGVVLAGTLTLAVSGQAPVTVGAGDSFYIRAGIPHTAANLGAEPLRLVVVELPHTRATPLVHGGLTASAGADAQPPATARRRLRGGRDGRRSSSR
jgi:quercetin dioxygenase-like cupin family protein